MTEIRVRGRCWLALLEALAGRSSESDAAVADAIQVATASGDDDLVSLVLSAAGFLSCQSGRPNLAVEYAERRLELPLGPVGRAKGMASLAQAQVDLRDPAAARSAELAVVAGTRVGVRSVVLEATACLAYAALSAGDADSAAEFAADLLRRLTGDDPGFQVAEAISIAALVWAARGDVRRCADLTALADAELRDHDEDGQAHLALFDPQVRAALESAGEVALAEARQRARLVPAHRRTAEAWRGLDGAAGGAVRG
jgi:ATP/maltotriose-dependent transcriptional regulator MalT